MTFFPEWLLAFALTLFVLDIFVSGEWLSWLAITGIASYATWKFAPTPMWAVLTFVLTFCTAALIYYFLLRKVINYLNHLFLMRNEKKDILERIVGQTGLIHIVDGKTFVSLNNELWSIDDKDANCYTEGEKVEITALNDGILSIKRTH